MPLPDFGRDFPDPPDPLAPAPGAARLFHSQVAAWWQLLSGVLSVGADVVFVVWRTLELPGGVDREMLLVDLRWADVRGLVELAGLVSLGQFSPRCSWLGSVLLSDHALLLSLPLRPDLLGETLEVLSLSPEGPLWTSPGTGDPTYGIFLDGKVGHILTIPEGHGLPTRALPLLPGRGHLQSVELVPPFALPLRPPAGLWEVPLGAWAEVVNLCVQRLY